MARERLPRPVVADAGLAGWPAGIFAASAQGNIAKQGVMTHFMLAFPMYLLLSAVLANFRALCKAKTGLIELFMWDPATE